jgi:two-component system cell cycle response regulator DivK
MAGEPILIVDDTPVNLKLTRILLTHEGYDVRTAASGEEALQVLEAFKPRLVLADIQMPGMDGLEMTRRIKGDQRHRDILVVALTALAMHGDEERARAAGCDGYITKPIDPRALGERVRAFLKTSGEAAPAPSGASDPFARAGIDDLRARFLEDVRRQAPSWVADLGARFEPAEAQAIAHQWVGSGGLLGYRRISELAREIETILRQKPVDVAELRESIDSLVEEAKAPTLGGGAAAVELEPPPPPAPDGMRPRILIVDDDPNLRALAKAFVDSQGMECRTSADGRSALAMVDEFRPHVIVLDVNMPEMGGYQVLAALRAEQAPVKVLLLTADEQPDTRNADDFLVKPFHPGELIVRLRKLVGMGAALA